MQKLLDGIRDFHVRLRPGYRERFAHLALGQAPDCLFVACSDSRVVPNLFASTDPGDLFVLRNVGNIVPPEASRELEGSDAAAGAAVEFASITLGVRDVVVCGHSACGAMAAALSPGGTSGAPHLRRWLRHVGASVARLERETDLDPTLSPVDRLSQAHVLQQLDHLRTYPDIAGRIAAGELRLNAWWFDLANAEVLAHDPASGRFRRLVELLE